MQDEKAASGHDTARLDSCWRSVGARDLSRTVKESEQSLPLLESTLNQSTHCVHSNAE